MNEVNSVVLLDRWKAGDEQAAQQIFDRYANRLVALARARLSKQMQRRVEPEDIVQSAYRSFFRRAGDRYELEKSGDLWRLLAAITISKLRGQVEFHTAKKRGVYLEQSVSTSQSCVIAPEAIVEEPRPEEAAALLEELTSVLSTLQPFQRQILELALQNQSIEEIGEAVQRSQRTVRRTLQQIRESLEGRLGDTIG